MQLEPDEDDEVVIKEAEAQGEADGEKSFENFRVTQPEVKPYSRGDGQKLAEVMADQTLLNKAFEKYENEKFAASNKAFQESRAEVWPDKTQAMGWQPHPLTPQKIDILGALLKVGQYRSSALYLSAAKQAHVQLGFAWSEQNEQAVKDALRSCLRRGI